MSKGAEYLRNVATNAGRGIASLCSANSLVIKAALEYARDNGECVLIEATANQVNQYGGYTGMKPADFRDYVTALAREVGLDESYVILGGDHLGPVVFKEKDEQQAMREAEELIATFVQAGFEKIHIDTSMRLGSDPTDRPLSDEVIAARGARLCAAAEQAFAQTFGGSSNIVYVIGSEVPIPGGTQASDEGLKVTTPEDFANTYTAFKQAFAQAGLEDAFARVIAVVVQPGVEFGDDAVHEYSREKARELTASLAGFPQLCFEGHSTDYQTQGALAQMVQDGIRILKVGPELTFALREGLFALQSIARETGVTADFTGALENLMKRQPVYWEKYFTGTPEQIALKRKYSYSDRWRYYAAQDALKSEMQKLFDGLDEKGIPLTLLSQYMPVQYRKVREGRLEASSEALVKDKVKEVIEKYHHATQDV